MSDFLQWLSQERWARPVAKDERAKSHQLHLAHQYSWLVFIYCAAYALAAAAALLWWYHPDASGWKNALITFGITFGAALRADINVSRKEVWLNVKFPQHEDGGT
jgi:hypothetical protein